MGYTKEEFFALPEVERIQLLTGKTPEQQTAEEVAMWTPVEAYVAGLKWSADTPDEQRTLVIGNIRGFYGWLLQRRLIDDKAMLLFAVRELHAEGRSDG